MSIKEYFKKVINLLVVTTVYIISFSKLIESETLQITTYYPAPYGGYVSLLTTNNTWLARDGGKVGIGTSSPWVKLHVNGWTRIGTGGRDSVQFETQNTFHRVAFNELRFWDWDTGDDMVTFNNRNVIIYGDTFNNGNVSIDGNLRVNGRLLGLCYYHFYDNNGVTICRSGFRVVGFIPRAEGTHIMVQSYPSQQWTVTTVQSSERGWLVCCRFGMPNW
ncbi:MAG: hypothetical protein K6357_07795 [Elusimicrobiota bacterium]